MTDVQADLDPTPLVQELIEQSKSGKLKWAATADRLAFVVSVAGNTTFRLKLVEATDVGEFGQPETVHIPVLVMLDEKGNTLWEIRSGDVKGKGPGLSELFSIARRIGNKLDERLGSAISALRQL